MTDEQLLLADRSNKILDNLTLEQRERRNFLLLKHKIDGYHEWLKEEREIFGKWFQDLLALSFQNPGQGPLGTCLYRDVIRETKDQLWETWLKVGPHGHFGE